MLDPVLHAATIAAAILGSAVPPAAPADAAPAPAAQTTPAAPAQTAPAAPAQPTIAVPGSRAVAEDAQLKELVPPPLTSEQVHALGSRLGAGPEAADTLNELAQRYEMRVRPLHDRALAAVRPRLAIAYAPTPNGTLAPEPGPELVAALEASATWRAQLEDADAELLRLLLVVRTDRASTTPAVLGYARTAERDDMVGADPTAALRLPALLDIAALPAADRQRVELQLDRRWVRTAVAIAARRREVQQSAIRRAQLWAEWGPAWELTAAPALAEARRKQLVELDARERAAEQELAAVNREAVIALLRALPPDAATRVRDTVDALVWPHLFAQERLLAQAVERAAVGADPALAPAMNAVLDELRRKLEGTRKDLSRRAARAEDLDAVLAAVELGQGSDATTSALEAQLDLIELTDRRRRLVRETAQQLRQMAMASGAPAAKLLDERVTALDAEQRNAQWMRAGLEARLQELGNPNQPDDAPPQMAPAEQSNADTPLPEPNSKR